jgi:RimJ/RimL family protein N-acetyltransferase
VIKKDKLLLAGEESERLFFRKLDPKDFDECIYFFRHPLSNRYWKSEITDSDMLCKEWIDKQMRRYETQRGGINILIHKNTNELIGWCGLLVQEVDNHEELEVGYSIIPSFWNKGYATEAAGKCIDYAFENDLSESIISIIQIDNKESRRVAEKIGLVMEKQTFYQNNPVYIYRITKQESQRVNHSFDLLK